MRVLIGSKDVLIISNAAWRASVRSSRSALDNVSVVVTVTVAVTVVVAVVVTVTVTVAVVGVVINEPTGIALVRSKGALVRLKNV